MKKLLLPLLLFTVFVNAQTQQDYYNQSPSGIDPVIEMTSNGESESVKMANEALKANKPSKIGQKLEKSLEKVENLETPKFDDVYQPAQPSENRNYNQSGNVQPKNQNSDVDPFSSPEDKSPSFQGERVNVDDYYTQKPDGSYVKKDTDYKQTNSKDNNNTMLIVVILIAGAGIIVALFITQKKPATGIVPLKNSLIQMFEKSYRENYINLRNDSSFPTIASSALHDLYSIVKGKSFFLSNQYNVEQRQVSILIDECFEEVYYKYFER